MVDRRLRNCPLCGQQNAMFMYRTDVGSGQTIATCSSCNDEIRVNPPDSPPLSPFSSPGFTNSSPMSQARILSSQEGKIETGSQESKDDPAFELTQPVTNSQSSIPSEPSSPEGLSSGEQVRRRGRPPRGAMQERIQAIRLARERNNRVPVRRADSYRTLVDPRAERERAVRALNTFMGRVPETPRERAQRLADADAQNSQTRRNLAQFYQSERFPPHPPPLPSSLAAQPMMTRILANPPAMMHKVSEAFELKKKNKKLKEIIPLVNLRQNIYYLNIIKKTKQINPEKHMMCI